MPQRRTLCGGEDNKFTTKTQRMEWWNFGQSAPDQRVSDGGCGSNLVSANGGFKKAPFLNQIRAAWIPANNPLPQPTACGAAPREPRPFNH